MFVAAPLSNSKRHCALSFASDMQYEIMPSFIGDSNFFSGLTPEQVARLEPFFAIKKVEKGQILQYKGDLNLKIYYVKQGCLRSYSMDEKGKEKITQVPGITAPRSHPPSKTTPPHQ